MKFKSLYITALAILCSWLTSSGYRYDDYSQGRSFFCDGQEWTFVRNNVDGIASDYKETARVIGDTAVSYYLDYYGDIVRVDQPCKIIQVISEGPSVLERRFAAYEWDAEIYVYSDKNKEFVQLLNFNKKENGKMLYCGEKWQVNTVDYIYPEDRLMKRCATGAMSSDKRSNWIYRIGADRLWLSDTKWENPGFLELQSYYEPKGNVTFSVDVFDTDTFVPDNLYYPDGKEWIYSSAYYEGKGQNEVYVHQKVEDSEEFEHVMCKKVSYRLEGSDSQETALVCSHDGVMYERGYMGLLTPRFDFRLSVGERALDDVPESEVMSVGNIEVNGVILRRLVFRGLATGSQWQYWVEGIGANAGNDMMPRDEMEDLSEIYYPGRFIRCEENGQTKFTANDFSIGMACLNQVIDGKEFEDSKVYQIDGKCVKGVTPGAIIIKSGRKYLLR